MKYDVDIQKLIQQENENIFGVENEFSTEVGSIGAKVGGDVSSDGDFSLKLALGLGLGISIDW